MLPSLNDIKAARERIKPYINTTPVMTSRRLDQLSGANLFFKCEHLQVTGAFKFRGAINAVLQLQPELSSGLSSGRKTRTKPVAVATHSSGNHGAALSCAAQIFQIPAHIVMPVNATIAKRNAVEAYGGKIIDCEPTLEAREAALEDLVEKQSIEVIPPYDDERVICGQGTAALEMIEQIADLDAIVVPVGGGGLLSGVSIVIKSLCPQVKVYGAEPEMADDAYRSFHSGVRVLAHKPETIAEGLQTVLGEKNFEIIRKNVDDILLVSEVEIIQAMELIWSRLKQVVEPSSAVTLAAILKNRDLFAGKRTGMILTGGNVDLNNLPFSD